MKPEDLIGTDYGKVLVAGAAGGIVRWATLRNNWKEGMTSIFVGALCALYLGPIVEPLFEPVIGKLAPSGDPRGFAAFFVGLGGVSLASFFLEIIAARVRKDKE